VPILAVLHTKFRDYKILILALCLSATVHGCFLFFSNQAFPKNSMFRGIVKSQDLHLNLRLKSAEINHQLASHGSKPGSQSLTRKTPDSITVLSLAATLQQASVTTGLTDSLDQLHSELAQSELPVNQTDTAEPDLRSVNRVDLNEIGAQFVMPEPSVETPVPVLDWFNSLLPYYFPTHLLTEKPIVTLDVSVNAGANLVQQFSGIVIMRLKINESGSIDQVEIDQSELPASAQEKLKQSFMKMRFSPGKLNHIAVKSEMRIEISLEKIRPKAIILETILLDQKK